MTLIREKKGRALNFQEENLLLSGKKLSVSVESRGYRMRRAWNRRQEKEAWSRQVVRALEYSL